MAWLTPEDVEAVYPAADLTQPQLDHIQGLAEGCIGPQEEPIAARLKAVMVDIAFRFWRGLQAASTNVEGYQAERTPEYGYEYPVGGPILSGFGLTDRECEALRKAVGAAGLWVQPVSRGVVETPSAPDWDPEFDVV